MTTRWTLAALAALTLGLVAPAADAGNPCIGDAKTTYQECKGDCKEDLQLAKDTCLDRLHSCVEVCRANRAQCRLDSGFDADIDACNATLAVAKQVCRDTKPAGSQALDECIDRAQVDAFQCRDQARENNKGELKACRAAFRACAEACPPSGLPVPPDPAQCKQDAKLFYKACKAGCLDDLQVQKDACRNRDHACVEVCRAERETCRALVKAPLDAAIDVCNVARDAARQTCRDKYAPDTPELDQCIDNAQVTAFICRDDAREAARPGFLACKQQFRSCAERCPPAS